MTGCDSRHCVVSQHGGMRADEPCSCDARAYVRELREALRLAEVDRDAARAELGAHSGESLVRAAARREDVIADLRHALDGDDAAARRAMREQLVDFVENERIKRHTVADDDAYARGKADGYRWCAEEILRRLRETSGAGASTAAPGPAFEKRTATGTLMVRAGDVLEGVEGNVTTRLQVTYVSEEALMARQLWSRRADGMEVGDPGRESTWTLMCRDWRKVDERKLHHDEKPQ